MIRKILAFSLCLIFLALGKQPILAADTSIAGTSASLVVASPNEEEVKNDPRVKKLENFLLKYDSPLFEYAQDIVELSDKYDLDYRLVVAISGVESTFCHAIPYNSYNCWGWNNGKYAFSSYPNALETVSMTLGTRYYDRGFDTPEKIGPIYAPPSTTWSGKVRHFMNLIEEEEDIQAAFLAKQLSI